MTEILPYLGSVIALAALIVAALVRRDDKAETARKERDAVAETARKERNAALDASLTALATGQGKILDIGTERALLMERVHGDVKVLASVVGPLPAAVEALKTEVRDVRHGTRADRAAIDARLEALEQRTDAQEQRTEQIVTALNLRAAR